MHIAGFGALYLSGAWQQLQNALRGGVTPCAALGLCQSRCIHLAAGLALAQDRPILIITHSEIRAQRFAEDLAALTGEDVRVFPGRNLSLRRLAAQSRDFALRRLDVISALSTQSLRLVVACAGAVMEPMAPPSAYHGAIIRAALGGRLPLKELSLRLTGAGYERVERVEDVGQFAVRGGIVDVFPTGRDEPVRLEFFGDEVDTLRSYDPATQRSTGNLDEVSIFPAREAPVDDAAMRRLAGAMNEALIKDARTLRRLADEPQGPTRQKSEKTPQDRLARQVEEWTDDILMGGTFTGIENHIPALYGTTRSLWDYMENPMVVLEEPARVAEACEAALREYAAAYREAFSAGDALSYQESLLGTGEGFYAGLGALPQLVTMQELPHTTALGEKATVEFSSRELNAYKGNIQALAADIAGWRKQKYRVLVYTGTNVRAKRLADALLEYNVTAAALEKDRQVQPGEAALLPFSLRNGFEDVVNRLVILGEAEAFGTAGVKRKVSKAAQRRGMELFADLSPGDYIVHETHGIGVFKGIKKLTANGTTRDYIEVEYLRGDMLYIPTENMTRVEKYIGSEGKAPRLNRLGGNEWERTKGRVRQKVRDIAEGLIKIYAKREATKGFAFLPDDDRQQAFEDAFPYEDTPDQITAIEDIKNDMQSDAVMDRLLCGDVGYGKTEVALRAAYKAILSGTQVAILAPTTVLCYQHYNTIANRFDGLDVRFEMLNRFRSPAQQQEILAKLARGELDIVVGTHRLLSKDVKFKSLGLLIVDEEQRFGVAHKEKIKDMKENVDVLVMTATPIPRTLNMSLNGIRDISIIETPPEERQPVQTYVLEYDEALIRDAVLRELGRGGQIFFLHNKVQTMPVFHRALKELLPEAHIVCAHGQMGNDELERVMLAFYQGHFDILLSTTIIENGLDIPNANTLIVYDADHFGLSQLYQLRGRVGRSSRLGYAYFTYRPYKALNETSQKRLAAIREFTEFGSGFKIAMRDLEIRGAGNLLGAEQHGQMAAVGYGMYCRIIDEAVRALRGEDVAQQADTHLDLKVNAHIPEKYIEDMKGRLEAYRRIARIEDEAGRGDVIDELVDRYGEPPGVVLNLMDVAMLKNAAAGAGIDSLVQRATQTQIRFVPNVRMDPGLIMGLVMGSQGRITMGAGETPQLIYCHEAQNPKDYFAETLSLVRKIALCKT